ncbi:MAG: TatD family hydrolase [Gammaproteobacteria bacterium]|nr:TatD family hydrolase [Gammaproteobacteria bacterium]
MIDICFNFTHRAFREDEREVLRRAVDGGVVAMVVPGSGVADSAEALALAKRYPELLYAGAGVHPHHAREWDDDAGDELRRLAADDKVVAIGETGLDYCRDFSPRDLQRAVFERQILLAAETRLPLFMHQRDAHDDFLAVLAPLRERVGNAVVHCFTGDRAMLADYLDLGLFIGVTGWICDERRGHALRDAVAHIPDDRLMIETDAPYLAPRTLRPAPRGRRNEPAFLAHIAREIADCRNTSFASLCRTVTANTRRFYGID